MIGAITTALSGLLAASKRVEISANNIANANTAGALDEADGPLPYAAQTVVQKTGQNGGVVAEVTAQDPGYSAAYAPNSPLANEEGFVGAPNVNLAEEAVNLKLAEVAYKANIATIQVANELSEELLNSFDEEV
jgi:flagellar basal-body rod protein FlgC